MDTITKKFRAPNLRKTPFLYSYRYKMNGVFDTSEKDQILYTIAYDIKDLMNKLTNGGYSDKQIKLHVTNIEAICMITEYNFTKKALESIIKEDFY